MESATLFRVDSMFVDDFEIGDFSKWARTEQVNGLVPIVVSSDPIRGAYSAVFETLPTLNESYSRCVAPIENMDNLFCRGYFLVEQPQALGDNDRFNLILFMGSDNRLTAVAGIRKDGAGAVKWTLWYRKTYNPTTGAWTGTHAFGSSIVDLSIPQVYLVELHYNRTEGKYELFINETLEATMTVDVTIQPHPIVAYVAVGSPLKSGRSGQPTDPTTAISTIIKVDDVALSDAYIGPVIPVSPTPQPNRLLLGLAVGAIALGSIVIYFLTRKR